MAVHQARIAPFINIEFEVTSAQPYRSDGVTLHGGLDISTGRNDPLYSMLTGTVLYSQYNTGGYGNCIIIQDDITGTTILMAHMRERSLKTVGSHVEVGEFIGYEGNTGQSTGIHTHLEIQYLNVGDHWNWNVPVLERPYVATFMGIPNQLGAICIYDGTPVPPTPSFNKSKFKWVLFTRRIKQRKGIY